MSISLIQRNFSAGEVSPEVQSRVDQSKYTSGLKTLRNAYVKKTSGVQNRPGTVFRCEINDSDKRVRLIKFVFSRAQKFVLEFGDQYIRFIKNGAQVTDLTVNITGITQANPGVFTSAAHGLVVGKEVILGGIGGMLSLNNRNFKVGSTPTVNTFTLTLMDGTPLDTSALPAYTSGGTASRVYEISSPYAEADISTINYAQSADVMTLVHPSYPVYELTRIADDQWYIDFKTFFPQFIPSGGFGQFLAGAAGAVQNIYLITAVSRVTGEESLPLMWNTVPNPLLITGVTSTSPAVVTTSVAHGLTTNAYIMFETTPANPDFFEWHKRLFKIVVLSPTTFSLIGGDASGFAAYVPGFDLALVKAIPKLSATPTVAVPNEVYVLPVVGDVKEYNFYKEKNGTFGLIGISSNGYFLDNGQDPTGLKTPPEGYNPFFAPDKYPSVVAYAKQRLMLGGTNEKPERIYASAIGEYSNFTHSSPITDSDAVEFEMASNEVNPVKHIFEVGKPIVLTETGEWSLNGTGSGLITPTEVNPEQRSYNGTGSLRPLIVNGDALFVQAQGSVVRDLLFDFQVDGYRGNEVSIFSNHLLEKNTVVDWDFQQIPNSIVWIVRDDGVLLSLTHLREHQILGWARHDFDGGYVENVCVIPGTLEDEVYFVIQRDVDGVTKRYIESFAVRKIYDILDNVFMDSALTYNGYNTNGSLSMTLSSAGGFTEDDLLTLTASASFFSALDEGNEIHFYNEQGDLLLKFAITNYVSATVVEGYAKKDVPAELQATATSYWARAVDEIIGFDHLEGKEVSVFADRFVVASPYNSVDGYPSVTVTNGKITLPACYALIHAGLPYVTDIETLEVDTAQGETLSAKQKLVSRVTGRFDETRGVFIGPAEPAGDDLLEGLDMLKIRDEEGYNEPVDLLSGKADLNIKPEWNNFGNVFIRQVDPLPLTLLSITGEGLFPFKGGA